jgi:hypothetical protein
LYGFSDGGLFRFKPRRRLFFLELLDESDDSEPYISSIAGGRDEIGESAGEVLMGEGVAGVWAAGITTTAGGSTGEEATGEGDLALF